MQQALELREVAVRQQREMTVDDLQRLGAPRRVLGKDLELQPQALRAVARAHARRLEALQIVQRDLELVEIELDLGGEHLDDLLERGREIAVLVQRVDQRGDDLPVARGQVGERELLDQVIAQRRCRDLLRIEIVVLGRRTAAPVGVAAAVVRDVRRIGRLRHVERPVVRLLAAVASGLAELGLRFPARARGS